MTSPTELGRIAYAAYGQTTNHKNFRGELMPAWEDLTEQIRQAWATAAHAVAVQVRTEGS